MAPAAMTIAIKTCVGLATLTFACVMPTKADVVKEVAPTGKLRVAIAVGPAPSALYAIKDDATGQYCGVTVELGSAMAKKLGVPVEFLPHLASGEIQNSAASGKWDVTFMLVDEERKKFVDFANAYHLLQSTYLVAPGPNLQTSRTRTHLGFASAVLPTRRPSGPHSAPLRMRRSSPCPAWTPQSPL
jgi:ABC-type amino acid transport substrate-binding protein